MERIVLAYSGSPETSAAIARLRDAHRADVIAVTVDLGQRQELEEVRDRALVAGAVRAHVLDLRDALARDFIIASIRAGALTDDGAPQITALGRPLLARALAEIAAIEQASIVAHGCAAGSRDASRLEAAVHALNPSLTIVTPAEQWGATRVEAAGGARQRDVAERPGASGSRRADGNLWGRAIAGGALADPWIEPPEDLYTLTQPPADWPAQAAYVEIAFDRGAPAAINGVAMPILDLIASLTIIAGAHGIGRLDTVSRSAAGVVSRQVCEAPAAVVLHAAHDDLQAFVAPADLVRASRAASRHYADLIDSGGWFTPLRDALDADISRVEEHVTGTVRLKFFKGGFRIVGRQSPHAPLCDDARTSPLAAGA